MIFKYKIRGSRCAVFQIQIVVMYHSNKHLKVEIKSDKYVNNCIVIKYHNSHLKMFLEIHHHDKISCEQSIAKNISIV